MIGAGKGGELSPSDYYFRTSVLFETGSPKYAWLNRILFMIIECLVVDTDISSIAYKIRRACAVLVGTSVDQSRSILSGMSKAYTRRSTLLHAAKFNVDRNYLQFVHSLVCEILLLLLVTGTEKEKIFALATEMSFGDRRSLIQDKRFKNKGLICKNRDNVQFPFPPPPQDKSAKAKR